MTTVGAKFWFGLAGVGAVGLLAFIIGSDSEPFGLLVLLSLVIAAVILGTLHIAVRDGNVPAAAAEVEAAVVPVRTQLPAPWPALGALGAGVMAIGAAGGNALFYVGLAILVVTIFEWMVQGWAERATGDRAYNAALRGRLMSPVEVPVIALLLAGVVLLAFSRVLLALPKSGSTIIAIVVAATILGVAALVATRPRIAPGLVSAVVVLGAVGLLGGGIVGAVAGERNFEPHDSGHGGGAGTEIPIEITVDGFSSAVLEIRPDETFTIHFANDTEDERSFDIEGLEEPLSTGPVAPGESATLEVNAPEGTYTFTDGGDESGELHVAP